MWRLYNAGIGLTAGFIGSLTVTHNYSVYTLQLTTVQYNTCWVFTLYLHWLPVLQYRRICSPASLQLFSEDCCSAQILTRNWICPRNCPSYIARERTPKKTPPPIPLLYDVITGRDPKENTGLFHCCLRIRCYATVVNKRFHCWLLTYSAHVTLFCCWRCEVQTKSA
jgi:hypothetical protein